MNRILTIAGSDSGGGAGIQADLKTITALGGYGTSVLTALTAQNTVGVQAINQVPAIFVEKQIDSVFSDIGADAVKTGLLSTAEVIDSVAAKMKQYRVERLVVDPVMAAQSGERLLQAEALDTLIEQLLPLATVVTPNLQEAAALAGTRVQSVEEMKRAAQRIFQLGPRYVLVKGGHLEGKPVDLLYDGKRSWQIEGERIESQNTHGTGCIFASAIATLLAEEDDMLETVRKAKSFTAEAIRFGLSIGNGRGPADPFAGLRREKEKNGRIKKLKEALEALKEKRIGWLIPEVSSNLGYALPLAEAPSDVAAFAGRIVRYRDSIAVVGEPEFGASSHIASIILTVMKFDPRYYSAMNIRYSRDILDRLKDAGLTVDHFDRKMEPEQVKQKEGFSLEWGVGAVLQKRNSVPDAIYDEGEIGKEPMIRILGRTPEEIVKKLLRIINK